MEGYLGIYSDGTVAEQAPLELEDGIDLYEDYEEQLPLFEPFKDLCKRRFLWYYDSYYSTMLEAEKKHAPGEPFKTMPFEGGGNGMSGSFDYPDLLRRMTLIRTVLNQETCRWAEEGAVLVKRDHAFAASLKRQHDQVIERFKKNDMVTLDIDLAHKDSPFVWILTYFGRPMTQLDGGMFRIRMSISPHFPEEQPRIYFETELFHHRIANHGTLCYFPKRQDDLQSHVEAIIEAIEEEHPPYDPRTLVNIQASKLFWGTEADKKQYNRLLRRSVQRSME